MPALPAVIMLMTLGSGAGSRGGGGRGGEDPLPPPLYSIHHGTVTKVEAFGAFVHLPGYRKHGTNRVCLLAGCGAVCEWCPGVTDWDHEVLRARASRTGACFSDGRLPGGIHHRCGERGR